MITTDIYQSPLGTILLAADEIGLTGLWFEGQKYFAHTLPSKHLTGKTPVIAEAKHWLDLYFSREEPDFTPTLHPSGTAFQLLVWQMLSEIPYGQTQTYGEIARKIAKLKKMPRMSAQAVGGAVGHNEIAIIIPCHRVIGADGSLTGYAGGIEKKMALLKLERRLIENE